MDRADIHNCSVREDVAQRGGCGYTHLPTGRVCIRPFRHRGACRFGSPRVPRAAESGRR